MAIRSFSPGRLSFLNSFAESANYNCAEKHTKLFVCELFLVTFPGLHCPKCHGCFLIYSFHALKPRNFDILHNGTPQVHVSETLKINLMSDISTCLQPTAGDLQFQSRQKFIIFIGLLRYPKTIFLPKTRK